MNDLPGVRVAPSLLRQDEPVGAHQLILTLDHDTFEGSSSLDNLGTDDAGSDIGFVSANLNSLLGLYERISFRGFTVPSSPRELLFGELSYQQPLNTEGTGVALSGWLSDSDAGGDLEPLEVESRDKRLAIGLFHPLIRQQDMDLVLSGEYE